MRNNLAKTLITNKPSEFFDLANDDRIVINTVDVINEEAIHVTYTSRKEFVTENPSYNIFVSLYTTSAARLTLYSYIRQVTDAEGCELLYTDVGVSNIRDID